MAVKMVLGGQFAGNDAMERFRTEAEAAANLKHPHIVGIHEVGEYEGYHYFSMDYIDGENLGRMINREHLDFHRSARLVKTVAEAIQYAHEHGILHRDLKPSNILIDSMGAPHVTDFGLAKQMEGHSELTISGQVLGSPNYMPPEQAEGKRALMGRAGDVYSLGAIIYHLLTGRPPFGGKTLSETLHKVIHTEVVAPRLANPELPGDLETICLKCLEKDPKRRYSSARELEEELDRFLRDEPILARPVGWTEKTRRWCRRKPAVATLTASLIIVFLMGFAGTLWQLKRVQAKSVLAQQQLAHLNVSSGFNLMQEGEHFKSLLWFTEALRSDEASQELIHRMCIASVLQACPRLVRVISHDTERMSWGAFSPVEDRLATVGQDLTLRVWDVVSGNEVCRTPPFKLLPHYVAFSPDGRYLAIALIGEIASVVVVDSSSGEIVMEPLAYEYSAANNQLLHPIFHPSNQALLIQSEPRTLQLTSIESGERIGPLMRLNHDIARIQFSADGEKLWTKTNAGYEAWELHGGKKSDLGLKPSEQHQAVFFNSHGDSMLVGNRIQQVGSKESTPVKTWHRLGVNCAGFSPDGIRLVTSSQDRSARIWNAHTGEPLTEGLGHLRTVVQAQFSPDGRRIASVGTDNTARVWDTDLGQALTPPLPHHNSVGPCGFSGSGRYLWTMHPNHFIYVWDLHRNVKPPVLLKPLESNSMNEIGPAGSMISPGPSGLRVDSTTGEAMLSLHPESRKTNPLSSWFNDTGQFVIVEGEMGKV